MTSPVQLTLNPVWVCVSLIATVPSSRSDCGIISVDACYDQGMKVCLMSSEMVFEWGGKKLAILCVILVVYLRGHMIVTYYHPG